MHINGKKGTGSALQENPLTGSSAKSRRGFFLLSFIALLALLVYLPALNNGFVSWDDGLFVYENSYIHRMNLEFFRWALTDTSIDYWRPLSWISHALDYALWGLNPVGHHLTNVLLHSVNTFLVMILTCKILTFLNRTTDDDRGAIVVFRNKSILIAAGFTGALFGLHPIHVESVAWVAERKDLLYSLFYLLGLISYTGYVSCLPEKGSMAGIFRNRRYYVMLLFFFLSLASKPMAITFPVVLLLLDWYPFERNFTGTGIKLLITEKIPFLAISVIVAASTVIAQKNVGAIVDAASLSGYERVLVSFNSLLLYLWKIIVPVNLLPLYPYPYDITLSNLRFPAAIVSVAAITAGCLVLSRKTKIGLAAWGFFLITVFPVLGLVQSGPQPMADRYMYLPVLAPFMLIGLGLAMVEEKCAGMPSFKWSLRVASLVMLILLCLLTVKQTGVWRDNVSLWSYVIDKEPGRLPIAYHNRGIAMTAMARYDQAVADSSKAIALDHQYVDAYHNRGNAYAGKGEYDQAIADYLKAISLQPGNAVILSSLGLAYAGMGAFDAAIDAYGKAIALKPDFGEAFNNRGLAYLGKVDLSRAFADFDRAGQLKPGDASVHVNRGLAYAAQERPDLEEHEYTAALALHPPRNLAATVHSNRGIIRFKRGDHVRALEDFNAAVTLNPESVAAHNNRGALYMARGDYALALNDFSRVLTLNPDLPKAYLDRGDAYWQLGRPAQAKEDFTSACSMGHEAGCRKARSMP